MKIKINVVNDHEETSVQDEDYLGQQVHTIGQSVHVGDVLLIKVRNKLFKCEVQDSEAYKSSISLFSVKIYPLDEDDKKLFENDEYRIVKKRDYMDGTLNFYKEIQHKNGDAYWEIDFTKGDIQFEWPTDTFVKAFDEIPFTVVKFLTKSVPSSAVQDNDITEYKPSIKPLKENYRNVFNPSQAIGEPVEDGDTFLIEAADKSFKCEIHETDDLFKNHQNLFTARLYPLDKEDVSIAYEDYFEVVLIFDQHVENHDHYVIDFTKGKISPVDYIPIIREDTPFTVTKFLTHSGKNSTVQDNDLTEYRNSIKPEPKKDKNRRTRTGIGQPPHVGDVLLIKVKDKLYECEIEDEEVFDRNPSLFSARIYPLDKDDKKLLENDGDRIINHSTKRKYERVTIEFSSDSNGFKNNKINWVYDFTKGMIKPHWNEILDGEQPFTVVKFLTKSIPNTAVKDHNLDLTYISQDLKIFIKQCLEFKELLEEHREAIEECIEDDQRSVELDGYDGEDPVESPNKKYLEMITFCIDDVEYNIDELIDQIRKR